MHPTLERCICEQQEIVFLCMEGTTFQHIFWIFHQIRCLFKICDHGIFLSNDWIYFQWVFRYHWKGLICNLPMGTVFSRDARMPINDIRILGVVVKLFRPSMAVVKMSHFFSVSETSPLLKSNLCPRKLNF